MTNQPMEIFSRGQGEIFTEIDPDVMRERFHKKPRGLFPKVSTVHDVVQKYIPDGAYLAVGGFGGIRIPTAILHEIVRQKRKNLGFSGHTATHDCQIMCAGECFDRCDIAYVIGLELRGLSPNSRKYFESGKVKTTEWTNAALAWRYRAAAMGISFIPTRVMLGTDTGKYSAGIEVACPFTGKKYYALPALYPDVAIIHVHRCDMYGNCQIDGHSISDIELSMAAEHVIITTEQIIPNEIIRQNPDRTIIQGYDVDAVVEVPFGSFPAEMPYLYYSDEKHLYEWMEAEKDPEVFRQFLNKYIFKTKDFNEYLQLCGGIKRMTELRREMNMIEDGGAK
jgi:glutaconate CoA-transferase, subunit A